MKTFDDLAKLPIERIRDLLDLATRLEHTPEPQALQGKVMALLFLSPSLRTLTSFQAAMARLGGNSFVVSPDMSIHGLEYRSGIVMDGVAAEHLHEAVPVLASYGDVMGIRLFAARHKLEEDLSDSAFKEIAQWVDIPLINMESAISHPCQALADWKTLDDLGVPENGKLVLSWVYHPDPLPLAVPASIAQMAALRGMEVVVLRPDEFGLPREVMQRAQYAAASSGGAVSETSDRRAALEDAHVVYAKSWASPEHYGHRGAEREIRDHFRSWMVDDSWFDTSRGDCRLFHCLPVRRGVEVDQAVLDGPRSAVIAEARNRMFVQMAVLHRLLVMQ